MLPKFVQSRIVLLVFPFLAYCFAAAENTDAIAQASALIRAHKIEQAEALLRSAAAADPKSPALHGALGKLLSSEQRYQDSVQELQLAVRIAPSSREYSMLLSEALIGWRHFDDAVTLLLAIQPRFEGYPEFHYDLGLAYYDLNKMNEAKRELEQALRLDPNFDRASFLLAGCFDSEGDFAKAEDIHRKLVKQHPNNATYWVMLGEALEQTGSNNGPEAVRACRRALALKPGDPRIQFVAATVFSGEGDFAAARPLLEHLERLDPSDLGVHVLIARVYARLGEPKLARREAAMSNELRKQKGSRTSSVPSADQNNSEPNQN
jgi:predicted Zn-dependent protease